MRALLALVARLRARTLRAALGLILALALVSALTVALQLARGNGIACQQGADSGFLCLALGRELQVPPGPELRIPRGCPPPALEGAACDADEAFLSWRDAEARRAPALDAGGNELHKEFYGAYDPEREEHCLPGYRFCEHCATRRESVCDWDGDCFCDEACREGAPRECVYKSKVTAVMVASAPLLNYVLDLGLAPQQGLWLEFGVFTGHSIAEIARRAPTGKRVYGFDSFLGLPEDYDRSLPKGALTLGGRLPPVAPNVELVPGWFNETLPAFLDKHPGEPVAFAHLDCDLFRSTAFVLDTLAGRMLPGTILVFDDLMTETLLQPFSRTNFRAVYEALLGGRLRRVAWVGKSLRTDEGAFRVLQP